MSNDPTADAALTRALAAALHDAGAQPSAAVVVGPPTAEAPVPPEGPWVLVPYGPRWAVGAVDRHSLAVYAVVDDAAGAVSLAVELATTPAASRPTDSADEPALRERGRRTAERIGTRTAARAGKAGPAGLQPGDVLDLVGRETARHLFALGTPYPQRAQPPSDVDAEYHRYEVLAPLPATVLEGLAAPWFGQPGGGAKVVLDAPARRYVDAGLLIELLGAG